MFQPRANILDFFRLDCLLHFEQLKLLGLYFKFIKNFLVDFENLAKFLCCTKVHFFEDQ